MYFFKKKIVQQNRTPVIARMGLSLYLLFLPSNGQVMFTWFMSLDMLCLYVGFVPG